MPGTKTSRFQTLLAIFFQPRTIQRKLVRLVSLLVLLPSLAFIVASIVVVLRNAQQQAIAQLESVASLKTASVEKWALDLRYDMVLELVPQPLGLRLKTILNAAPTSPEYQKAYREQLDRLKETISRQQNFSELFLLDLNGQVVLSTNPEQEQKNYAAEKYFREGLTGVFFSAPIYDLARANYDIIIAQPVIFEGKTLGVFAGRANLAYINGVMVARAGLGQTGETYLVDANFAAITPLTAHEYKGNYVRTDATSQAIEKKANGSGLYTSYYGDGVIGVYKWIPEIQMVLVAEQTQAEAFSGIYSTLAINISVTVIALLISAWMAAIFGRNIGRPVAQLAAVAEKISAGDLSAQAPVESQDEIGQLATAFNSMTSQLRLSVADLEERVRSRTLELETANQLAQKNARELKIISEVSRTVGSEQNIEKLLPLITHLISEKFDFYHVGIFLLDETNTFAVLRAANSQGGQRMLARKHKLEVGLSGIVGFVAHKGQPRIALDTGADAVFINNPDLPDTHSEMALPLNLRGKTIGVLDVQSTRPAAFTNEDAATLSILAEQVAIAIDNARLFNETQRALAESQTLYRQFMGRIWEKSTEEGQQTGYIHSITGGQALAELVRSEEIDQALQKGELVIGTGKALNPKGESPNIAVPIKLRDQIVGVLNVRAVDNQRTWSQGELSIVQAISERVAFALENARLLEDSQRRAAREQAIGEISNRISSAVNIDDILRATVNELGKKLKDSEIVIQLNTENTPD